MRYLNYARRSSNEKSNKQIKSIEDQLADTRRLARERGLHVVEELTESRSAKEPGRPVFNRMVERIQRGEADAILCWKLDRLSRNPIDAATLRWMMTKGQLLEIHTPHQVYRPEDNALITAVENAMAEQYIADLRRNVLRGMKSKCEAGGFPLMVPSGYRNDRLTHEVEVDEERFTLLRRAWEMLLTGTQTVPQVHKTLVNSWGYRGRVTKSNPLGKLTLSALYNIFRNPFYKGSYTFMGQVYTHKYPRMVTPAEWSRAQEIVSQRARKQRRSVRTRGERATLAIGEAKPVGRSLTYTGLLTCTTCGYWVTAEKAKGHVYYHCNNTRGTCTKKGMREEKLEGEIEALLDSVTMPPHFEKFALEVLRGMQGEEEGRREEVEKARRKTAQGVARQKEALLSLYLQGHLDADEYGAKKQELAQQEADLRVEREGLDNTDKASSTSAVLDDVDATLENVVHFVTHARSLFGEAGPELRRSLAKHLAEAYLFNNGSLQIELHPLFAPVRYSWRGLPLPENPIEPLNIGSAKGQKPLAGPLIQQWCSYFEEYRTSLAESGFYLPKIEPMQSAIKHSDL